MGCSWSVDGRSITQEIAHAEISIPHSVDLKKLILNSVSYGSSLGVAAAIACAVALLIPRIKKNRGSGMRGR